ARTIRGEIGPRFPTGFFVVDFAGGCAGLGFHPPESAGAVNVAMIGDEENFLAVARPDRIDFQVVPAVVVAREIAFGFAGEPDDVSQFCLAQVGAKDVEAVVEGCGDEGDTFPVGGPARLDVYLAAGGELGGFAAGDIEQPQLHRVFAVRNVNDAFAVGRPIG